MGFFKRKKAAEAEEMAAEIREEEQPAEEARKKPERALLRGDRMSGVFWSTYLWMFTVSLDYDSYQLESGTAEMAEEPFPLRGYYSRWTEQLKEYIVEDQREEFEDNFSRRALLAAFTEGRTNIGSSFYIKIKAPNETEAVYQYAWYRIAVTRIADTGVRNQLFLFVKQLTDEEDNGRLSTPIEAPAPDEQGARNWSEIRYKRLLKSDRTIFYEYEVENDTITIHYARGEKRIDRKTPQFLSGLNGQCDVVISHESITQVRRLFEEAKLGRTGETEILFRKNGMQGAPFLFYKMTCCPLEETGRPTWLIGTLEEVETEVRLRNRNRDYMQQITRVLQQSKMDLYELDMNHGIMYSVVYKDGSFQRDKLTDNLSAYFKAAIEEGRIAPESQEAYKSLVRTGYLESHTVSGPLVFDSRVKLKDDQDFRWISDIYTPIDGHAGHYMRQRRDITEMWEMRRRQYELDEKMHFSDYYLSVLDTIAGLVEFRNVETGAHIMNVRQLTRLLLEDLAARSPQYKLTARQIEYYTQATTIHDIGKITIPDQILNKPGPLDEQEYEIMKTHSTNGAKIVARLDTMGDKTLQEICRDIALHHHERYDGNGYPDGLAGDDISIGAQVTGLADAYDALVSERCYKSAVDFDTAREMILSGECGVFNPRLLDSMKAVEPKMRAIYLNPLESFERTTDASGAQRPEEEEQA